MNISPKRDVDGAQILIRCMQMVELDNKLEKNQQPGDATKAPKYGQTEMMDSEMPKLDIKIGEHEVTSDGHRIMKDGEIQTIKIDKNKRNLQVAIINEQSKVEKDIND